MPWTPGEFAERHNHQLSAAGAAKVSSIANAIIRSGGDEGVAIAVANKYANRHHAKMKTKKKHEHGFGSLDGS